MALATLRTVDTTSMRETLDSLINAEVDGIAVIAPVDAAVHAVHGLTSRVPTVMVGVSGPAEIASVAVDQILGARLAVRHLIELGRQSILHVSGPPRWSKAEARIRGRREELGAAGLSARPAIAGDWSPQSGYRAAARVLANQDATAVFASNDQTAWA